MASKKYSKPRRVAKPKGKGFSEFNKKPAKQLPDTSRIP